MSFLLTSHNVVDYLIDHKLCKPSDKVDSKVQQLAAKNFNLLVSLPESSQILVKQERLNREGKAFGEFFGEWRLQELLQHFPELNILRPYVPEALSFDRENSILIFNYLDNYQDLANFYAANNTFPPEIASSLGKVLAAFHRKTFNQQDYYKFFSHQSDSFKSNSVLNLIQGLERITPEIIGSVPADGLKFFALYQRYDSLGQALWELGQTLTPTCLTHNDLKLNNILLAKDWATSEQEFIRLIDWERCAWGDPAYDLGILIGSYLQIWLNSLVISKSLSIEESLRLATTPLDLLQPSIAALSLVYLKTFPEIIEQRPDFLQRAVQWSGFALIEQIQAMIQYQKSFGNTGIAMLQVAKTLLSRPTQSIPTIFGTAAAQLTQGAATVV